MSTATATFVTRFAPSPTGFLHLGHAYSALVAYQAAQQAGGQFLLRLEDIDQTRCRPEFVTAIYQDLAWLGIEWEEPVRQQSDHFDFYTAGLEKLKTAGLLYRCFKTRKEIIADAARAPHHAPGNISEFAPSGGPLPAQEEQDRVSAGDAFAWRLSMQAALAYLGPRDLIFREKGTGPQGEKGRVTATPDIFGDVILGRKDAGTSYHMACVLDDGLQDITHVIRGEDLFSTCHLHCMLQALLELPTPVYQHHRLIVDESGKRYAKRDRSVTLQSLRAAGITPAEIKAHLGLAS